MKSALTLNTETKNESGEVMKKNNLILTIIFFLVLSVPFNRVSAQDKTKEQKEQEQKIKEEIDAQKKAMVEQQKLQEELKKEREGSKADRQRAQYDIQEAQKRAQEAMRDFRIRIPDTAIINDLNGIYWGTGRNRSFGTGDPFGFTSGAEFFGRPFDEGERTTWDFSKSIKETTFSRDYTFDVEPTVSTVVMAINGDCKAGEIRIRIVMPNGKTYSDIVIDEFGNLNWRKSFAISDTENQDKAGAWKFEINSSKATGFFKISLQTY
jgi:hypothetical protein